MPTLAGLKRRGFTPESINSFCRDVGVSRMAQYIPFARMEVSLRTDLDAKAPRAFAVLRPLRLEITNFADVKAPKSVEVPNHPTNAEFGKRTIAFTPVLFIERDDFRLEDSKDFFGLAPGKEVGLRFAGNVKCTEVVRNGEEVTAVKCTLDPSGANKVKGRLHWVPSSARTATVRLYGDLFHNRIPTDVAKPTDEEILPGHCPEEVLTDARVDDSVKHAVGAHYQFERVGYFVVDEDSTEKELVLNRCTALKAGKKKELTKGKQKK